MQADEGHSDSARSTDSLTKRKSLGLKGAKTALKRLFSRQPSSGSTAGDSRVTAGSSVDQLDTVKQEGSHAEESRKEASNTLHNTKVTEQQLSSPLRAEESATNNKTNDTELDHAAAVQDDASMNALQPRQQQPRPRVRLPGTKPIVGDKENVSPETVNDVPVEAVQCQQAQEPTSNGMTPEEQLAEMMKNPVIAAQRAEHMRFMGEALDMAQLALKINETPVGCVLVHNGEVIARGMNATNVTRNGTRHAELMAISALLSRTPTTGAPTTRLKPKEVTDKEAQDFKLFRAEREAKEDQEPPAEDPDAQEDAISEVMSYDASPHEGNEDGRKSHLYPYGQKLLDIEAVSRSIITESILYVTVEPCIMCASLLRQLGIKKVYFGAVNDKFGGTGGVFSIHANSLPVSDDGTTASAHPIPKPIQLPDGTGGSLGVSFPPGGGDGGTVEAGYEIEGGWGRDEAVGLLRKFYVQENGRAPVPRKKEGRAARLAALEKDGDGDTGDEEASDQDRAGLESRDGNGPTSTTNASESEEV